MLYSTCFPPQQRHLLASGLAFSQCPVGPSYSPQRLATRHCDSRSSGRCAPVATSALHHPLPDPTYLTGAA